MGRDAQGSDVCFLSQIVRFERALVGVMWILSFPLLAGAAPGFPGDPMEPRDS